MGDRKSINKYYPPDFDPSKLTRQRRGPRESLAASLLTVRLMSPFSMRCTTCGEFIYKGKKFNAKKQPTGEQYLGVKIIRFYIRCPRCSGEIRFKTEPKISDYVCESGAKRNFEPWRDREVEDESLEDRLERLEREEKEAKQKEEKERMFGKMADGSTDFSKEDPMAALETRALEAKLEMAREQEIDELRARNSRIEAIKNAPVASLDADVEAEAEDARLAREAFNRPRKDVVNKVSLLKMSMPKKPAKSLGISKGVRRV